jgi:ribonuclease HI
MILKRLNISIHPPLPPVIKEVIWHPPLENWVKCNTDGATNNLTSSCGGIFRNHNADFLCGFAENTGLKSAFMAELCGAMRAIELAHNRNWTNLWLESDSSLVVQAFSAASLRH